MKMYNINCQLDDYDDITQVLTALTQESKKLAQQLEIAYKREKVSEKEQKDFLGNSLINRHKILIRSMSSLIKLTKELYHDVYQRDASELIHDDDRIYHVHLK